MDTRQMVELIDAMNRVAARTARLEASLIAQTKALTLCAERLTSIHEAMLKAQQRRSVPWWRRQPIT